MRRPQSFVQALAQIASFHNSINRQRMGPKGSRKRKAEEPVEAPVEEQPADNSSEDERKEDVEPETDYTMFQQQIKQKERQLDKFCVMLSHIEPESEEDDDEEEEKEPTMEQLQALSRVSAHTQTHITAGTVPQWLWQLLGWLHRSC